MRHNPVSPVVLAAALSACSVQPELLNSARIEQRFGSYGIEVLRQEGAVRRSNLYSVENGVRVCRTYAVVRFVDPVHLELAATHRAVLAGESIGTTFDTAGWEIRKQTMHVGTVRVPDSQHVIAGLMQLDSATTLGLHVYQLFLEKNARSTHYATIVESHHPAYLTETDLMDLYAQEISAQLDTVELEALVSLVLD